MLKKFLFSFCSFIFCCMQVSADYRYELSICAIFKNEAPYLREWIEFHRLVGVRHFVLCSHNSTDEFKEVLKPYIRKGIVELQVLSNDPDESVQHFNNDVQCPFYSRSLEKLRGVSKWVAFIDSDEYLFPSSGGTLTDVLRDYEAFGGVCVNWQMFGTSYVSKIEPGELQIERLIACSNPQSSANIHVKSIVRPERALKFENPHFALYLPGFFQVNTDSIPFVGPYSPYIQVGRLRINHYWTRDEFYYWTHKVPRQVKWWGHSTEMSGAIRDGMNESQSFEILIYLPALKLRMGL